MIPGNLLIAIDMNTFTAICLAAVLLAFTGCSRGIPESREYSLKCIKLHAKNGQIVKSAGVISVHTGKREFVVGDTDRITMILDLSAFKKESKYLKAGNKVTFTGRYTRKVFAKPEIRVITLNVVDDFK